ncbi:erythromycin esterase [Streptomyces sp. NRRL F-4489]|uniref:erythromycin esterase family protein n=1 Tax=Streptomyces sp. NRRL F-4489 TaxID=1609095 RepID=UPI00074A6FD8|nr:erythromycin esterase family protein [Streptomyces sp. NRRL F-4489]KUL38885.1 erythromycin esterase [Streptomyces sp. NRRL F-4489]
MSQDIGGFLPPSCHLFALGEPTHQEPAFGHLRNALFAQLAGLGFRSIALETDRVAALLVDDFVQGGTGDLDTVLSEGFTHNFGELEPNRQLIAWMRRYNRNRPPQQRLAFHGFDAPTENTTAPSPRRCLEYARDYLRRTPDLSFALDLDPDGAGLRGLLGDDERWHRTEAIMDPAMSIGATAEAGKLRVLADDMLTLLHARAPLLIAATSRAEWRRAKTHLTAGIGLLRYHKQAAQPGEQTARVCRLLATRDALMAENLLDIRSTEADRGPTLIFANNLHLQRNPSTWRMGDTDITWSGAGSILASLMGKHYAFVAGSLGRSQALDLPEPEPDTYEAAMQRRFPAWGLTATTTVPPARTRTDTAPYQGYFPLDQATVDAADALLHINDGAATTATIQAEAHAPDPAP